MRGDALGRARSPPGTDHPTGAVTRTPSEAGADLVDDGLSGAQRAGGGNRTALRGAHRAAPRALDATVLASSMDDRGSGDGRAVRRVCFGAPRPWLAADRCGGIRLCELRPGC